MLLEAGVDNAFHRRQLLEYRRQLLQDMARRQEEGGQGTGSAGMEKRGHAYMWHVEGWHACNAPFHIIIALSCRAQSTT